MRSRLLILGACLGLGLSIPCAAASTQTIVSLTFDDGLSDAPTASQIMGEFGFKGTFFIITGELGTSGYMTVKQVKALQTAGHEIAGHTITHPDLTTLTPAQAQNEVCGGRTQLINLGFNPVDFAYPYGASNSTVEAIVSTCYGSGRGGWELDCTYTGCSNAESIPPVDAYWIRTPDAIVDTTTVSQIEQYVTNAENSGGGWVPLQFHHVCDNDCDLYSITPANLTSLLGWLQARASSGTVVETVSQVMSGLAINPFPGLSSITPGSVKAGSSAFIMTLTGTGYIKTSTVQWNGTSLATTWVSSTTLTAVVPANDLASPGIVTVTVVNPSPGGGTSTAQSFSVTNNPSLFTIWGSSSPSQGDGYHDPSSIEVGVRFRSDVAGAITGLRFYKWSFNTGPHIGNLWTTSGTLLTSAAFSNETASGWQSVIFSTPVVIAASTTYVASYFTTGGYAATTNYFTTAGVDNPPLHALQSSTGALNGLYLYGPSSAFPTQGSNNSNFWVDVMFSSAASTANPVPILGLLSPSSAAAGSSTFTLTATGSNFISSSTVLWNGSARTTTFINATTLGVTIPASDLVSSGTASVTVFNPAPGGGTSSAQTFTITSSSGQAGGAFTIWSSTVVPTDGYKDPSPLEVGVKFRSDVTGFVTGLRFYKGSFNTGVHTGNLWTSSGTLLARAVYTGETASGWQQVSLSTPVAISANTTYVASYFTTTGYSVNTSYFTSAVNNPPLHALQNGTDGGNGVYLYSSTSTFPNQSTNSNNYWVDLVFVSSGTGPPSNPIPTLSSIAPSSATVGGSSFTLTLNGSNFISSSTVRWNGAARATTFVTSATIRATILAGDIVSAGTATVTVFNPAPGGGLSAAQVFTVSAASQTANPIPVLVSITPSSATVGGSTFTLTLNGSNFISSSTVRWNGAARTTAFISSTSLRAMILVGDTASPGTALVTVFNPAPGGGTSGSQNFSITASTSNGLCPCTIWAGSVVPGDGYKDPSSIEIGVHFRSDTSGYITGIRFYKGSFNTGTHTGNLWTTTGSLLATAVFTGETASGWQTVYFSTPVAVTANTIYVASYFTTTGYSVNTTYFTTGVDNAPLHAPQNSTSTLNGVYLYSAASAFPTQSTNSSNYWVDVVFNTTPNHPANSPAFLPPPADGETSTFTDLTQGRVYPNPWRSDQHRGHDITFDQWPVNSTIKIFTVSAHWVKTLDASTGSAQWDLTNDSGQAIASGFYIYLVTDNQGGKRHGTLAVIR